jgi:aminoglycoside 6-adenylyltransferase
MRTEREVLDLILDVARGDARIRAVIMNGSRANPNVRRDPLQDFDIVYLVTEVAPFRGNREWIRRFGELMILQTPDDMQDPPPGEKAGYAFLMQFTDGNRVDLTILPAAHFAESLRDSLSVLLLDKDSAFGPFPPPSERDYLPTPPTAKQFSDCCNEFWWLCPYVAKGLWRGQLVYAKFMLDHAVRDELVRMLTWYVAVRTGFSVNLGGFGKNLQRYLEPELWDLLRQTYAAADADDNWEALFAMGRLFRTAAVDTASHFGFEYPLGDDERVSAYLERVRRLPADATEVC